MRGAAFLPSPLPRLPRRIAIGVIAGALALLLAGPKDATLAQKPAAKKVAVKKQAAAPDTGGAACLTKRTLMTVRGEIVDYYCYIEKGARGPEHLPCAVQCVAGDVCMGIVTTDDQLFMISVNHMRAMTPLQFKGIVDPFNTCRGLLAQTVDLTGYAMERKGQKIIEIMGVKRTVPGTPLPKPRPVATATSPPGR